MSEAIGLMHKRPLEGFKAVIVIALLILFCTEGSTYVLRSLVNAFKFNKEIPPVPVVGVTIGIICILALLIIVNLWSEKIRRKG